MDLAKTQAQWNGILERRLALALLAPARLLKEIRDRFRLERCQVLNWGDRKSATPHLTAITLTGANPGVNLSADGRLYVRFVTNGGNWDVNFYTATGASGLVGKVTNVAASATGTIVAQNSSGLTGSVTLGATIAADASDNHQVYAFLDFPALLRLIFTGADSGIEEDAKALQAVEDAYDRVATALDNALSAVLVGLQRVALSAPGTQVAQINKFLGTREATLFADAAVTTSGTVTRAQSGLFPVLKAAMHDDTNAGTQDVVKRVPSAGAGVFASTNQGLGTVASHTPGEAMPAAILRFRCVDDTIGAEQFDVTIGPTRAGDTRNLSDGTRLQVKQPYSGPYGFGPITLLRTRTKTGDGSDLNLAAMSNFSETGESSTNTSDGVLYWKIVSNSSNWDVSFYTSSTYSSGSLVAKATNVATGATFQATQQNSSGLTINGKVGSGPTTNTTGTLNLNPFRRQNASLVPDEFSVTVTVAASPGLIQTLIADLTQGGTLNSDTSGSESIPDAYAMANTFPPFISLDN